MSEQVLAGWIAGGAQVAVDASHLYWANEITSTKGTIVEANLDGTGAKVIASRQNGPTGVAVGP